MVKLIEEAGKIERLNEEIRNLNRLNEEMEKLIYCLIKNEGGEFSVSDELMVTMPTNFAIIVQHNLESCLTTYKVQEYLR